MTKSGELWRQNDYIKLLDQMHKMIDDNLKNQEEHDLAHVCVELVIGIAIDINRIADAVETQNG
jgi:hypothetical protein